MSNDQTTPNPAKTSTPSKGAPQGLARSTASATDRNQMLVRASSSPDDPVRDGVQLGIIAFTTAAALIGLLVIGAVAERVGQKTAQVRKQLERNGQVAAVRSDLRTRKALEWLTEHVELVDEGGNTIDRASLEAEPEPEATTEDE